MKDLDFTSLRHFVSVCEVGSFTQAAEKEHIVTSAISKRIAQLEEDLGVVLLSRSRRGVAPTAAGETLLEHSRNILNTSLRVIQDMQAHRDGIRGKVHLLGTTSAISGTLPDDVAAFMKLPAHREIQIELEEALSPVIVRRICEGSALVGVVRDATDLQGLANTPYRRDNLAVVVPSGHPLAQREVCHFEDTLDYEHVGLEASSAINATMAKAATLAGKRLRYRARVSSFETALRVVSANLAISIIPRETVALQRTGFDLKVIALANSWAHRGFVICRDATGYLPKAAQLLVAYLENAARL